MGLFTNAEKFCLPCQIRLSSPSTHHGNTFIRVYCSVILRFAVFPLCTTHETAWWCWMFMRCWGGTENKCCLAAPFPTGDQYHYNTLGIETASGSWSAYLQMLVDLFGHYQRSQCTECVKPVHLVYLNVLFSSTRDSEHVAFCYNITDRRTSNERGMGRVFYKIASNSCDSSEKEISICVFIPHWH